MPQLDLSTLTRQYAGRGSKAYHPATLLAILVYGYATGIFSSRRLEQATYDSVAFRFIAGGHGRGQGQDCRPGRGALPLSEELKIKGLRAEQIYPGKKPSEC
ncbi:MAG: hypothetical protein CAPSK01_000416 [Candidatus Accumulibacter vicinus]|uniref:Transposase InsH N-terminal domain-containing protein n=1 Tax=Candidatus Accumulibacter vicinus TaxID=2954382 RepID=A0A084Y5M3_9PROT|nr:MAG: hypothetical protein CAPSK01_000416 [Candidatus Accumulibacter vicinus]